MARRKSGIPAKPLLVIAVIAAAAYAGPRAYFSYRMDQALSRLQDMASPAVSISYDSVWAELKGDRATVYDVAVAIPNLGDTLVIDEVHIEVSGFNGLGRLSQDRISYAGVPETMAIGFERLRLDVGDPIYQSLMAGQSGRGNESALSRLGRLGCANPSNLLAGVIEEARIRRLVADGRLRLDYQQAEGRLEPSVMLDLQELFRVELAADLRGIGADNSGRIPLNRPAALADAIGGTIQSARLRIADQGGNRARNSYCAERIDSDVEGAVARHVEALGELMERTTRRSPAFLKRYREYIRYGGDIVVDLTPEASLNLQNMTGLARNISAFRMNPTVQINGEAVNPETARWLSELAITPANEVEWGDSGVVADADSDSDQTGADASGDGGGDSGNGEREVEPRQLADFDGYQVRITTAQGKTYAGRISSVDDSKIEVQVPMAGGHVGYIIQVDAIERAVLQP